MLEELQHTFLLTSSKVEVAVWWPSSLKEAIMTATASTAFAAPAAVEHANITVRDAPATAAQLCGLFDWSIRWQGPSIHGGHTVHVGGPASYLALYTPPSVPTAPSDSSYGTVSGLNHIGVVVTDLAAAEARVRAAGLTPHSHADYEPGRRFYFETSDGLEVEVISYALVD
jgi:Glyoxalase/Bleomycin resistance protein/Dioxygenase superfamily